MQVAQSVCAEADRLSEVLCKQNKMEDLAYQNSNSTAEDDPIIQINKKAKKLREKQARYIAKQQSRPMHGQPIQPLTEKDWRTVISQRKPLDD